MDFERDDDNILEEVEKTKSTSGSEDVEANFDILDIPTGIEEIEVFSDEIQPEQEWMDIIGSGDLKKKVFLSGTLSISWNI